jgi:uncharacterized membrane protein YkgB
MTTEASLPVKGEGLPTKPRLGWTRLDLAIVALLGLLCLLFFWRIVTPNPLDRSSFPPGDFHDQFYAFSVFEASQLRARRLPLWNPYTFSGHPFLADVQSAIFYPPSLITVLLSLAWWGRFSLLALEWETISHFFLASLFTYLFARRLLGYRGAALASALTFTYGGYLTSYPPQQLAVLETDVWLPLILFCLDLALVVGWSRRGIAWGVAAGGAWGMALLAGHPQSAMYVFYTSLLYFAFRAASSPPGLGGTEGGQGRRRWGGKAGLGGLFIFIGFWLAAAQWLPSLEYMRLSVRASAGYEQLAGGFPLGDMVQFLLPGVVSLWSPLYVGILPLLLAGVALAWRRDRQVIFWGLLALGALILSFGGHTPVYRLFYRIVPGFNLFKSQERAAFVVSFSLALLAGYGLRALSEEVKLRRWLARTAAILALGTLLLTLAAHGLELRQGEESLWGAVVDRGAFLALLLALSWGLLRKADKETGGQGDKETVRYRYAICYQLSAISWWLALAVGLILLDLFTVNGENNVWPAPPEDPPRPGPVIQALLSDPGPFRVHNEWRLPGNYGDVYGIEDTWGASPLHLQRYQEFVSALPQERVWKLLNVTYVLTWYGDMGPQGRLVAQEPKDGEKSSLHRLAEVGPRAYIVHRAEVIPEDEVSLERLAATEFDLLQAVVLAEPPPLALPGTQVAGSRVEIVGRRPGWLLLEAEAAADGLLVLSEIYYPGWRALVDGREVPVYRANYTLQAVPLTAGLHRVELLFDPWSVKVGLAISGLTLTTSLLILLWCFDTPWFRYAFGTSTQATTQHKSLLVKTQLGPDLDLIWTLPC